MRTLSVVLAVVLLAAACTMPAIRAGEELPVSPEKREWIRRLADEGDARAQFLHAYHLQHGLGGEKDVGAAIFYYLKAAVQGDADANYALGSLFLDPEKGFYNPTEAVKYLRAAGTGHNPALDRLGNVYSRGEGVPVNYAEAMKYYRVAAERGFASSQYNMGVMNMVLSPQNHAEALEWFTKAADQGMVNAWYNLGVAYAQGLGVERNEERSYVWFRLAAEEGLPSAMHALGVSYSRGRGAPFDPVKAFHWLMKSATAGDYQAQAMVGLLAHIGFGVPSSNAEAERWFRIAGENGWKDVAVALEDIEKLNLPDGERMPVMAFLLRDFLDLCDKDAAACDALFRDVSIVLLPDPDVKLVPVAEKRFHLILGDRLPVLLEYAEGEVPQVNGTPSVMGKYAGKAGILGGLTFKNCSWIQ